MARPPRLRRDSDGLRATADKSVTARAAEHETKNHSIGTQENPGQRDGVYQQSERTREGLFSLEGYIVVVGRRVVSAGVSARGFTIVPAALGLTLLRLPLGPGGW